MRLDMGFDIVGALGSLFLLRCGIPLRIGVKGYAGGYAAATRYITYEPNVHVSEACIKMPKLLGINDTPSLKPKSTFPTKRYLRRTQMEVFFAIFTIRLLPVEALMKMLGWQKICQTRKFNTCEN